MHADFDVRRSGPGDIQSIRALYRATLAGEDLSPLLDGLLVRRDDVLSLAATSGDTLIGHIAFSICRVDGIDQRMALLGPLAVAPERQRQGIGSALIRDGFARLGADGISRVLVLGDPAYYGRLGFSTEADIAPPYPLVAEWRPAWQSLALLNGSTPCNGRLIVPEFWLRPELWAP
ncbi:MAG: N-acetyltransferase [Hyphomicrobiaceae bacterium]|nr:N-acetyltransferase [Hyphomicrobiaceae bacterium]